MNSDAFSWKDNSLCIRLVSDTLNLMSLGEKYLEGGVFQKDGAKYSVL